ncbi:MAG: DUF1194 domain-containing protein [Hyphomicrobiales bacterium]
MMFRSAAVWYLVLAIGFLGAMSERTRAAAELVDLELVLAVDASGSVDDEEFRLQLGGTAKAFRDGGIQQAIRAGPTGRIAVALVLWADASRPTFATDWYILASPADAERWAGLIESLPRRVGGGTGIGEAVVDAIRMIERNGISAARQVVDISGDGKETPPRRVQTRIAMQARAMANARGVTVNGLAILSDVPDLGSWYSRNVTAGLGSFVMTARDFVDFERAIKQKLLREIAPPIARLRHPPDGKQPNPAGTRHARREALVQP